MKVGDLVMQKCDGMTSISNVVKEQLNMGCVGIIVSIEAGVYFSYDGRSRGRITVRWSNGTEEMIPEFYLELL